MKKKFLSELNKGDKIYIELSDGSTYIIFDHVDGMYSHSTTEKGGSINLSRNTELVKNKDGYNII